MTQKEKTYKLGQLLVGKKTHNYYGSIVLVVSNLISSVGSNGGYTLWWLIAKNRGGTKNEFYSEHRLCAEAIGVIDNFFEEV